MKVLVADKFEKSGLDGLKAAGCEVLFQPDLKDAALGEALVSTAAAVLVVRSTKVTEAMMPATLKLIVRAGAGYNTIDVKAATAKGIAVSNCPGKNSIAVAELTMALMLAVDRRVADNVADLRAGKWNKKEYSKARGLFGQTLGVLGAGNIGIEVMRRAAAFGMPIVVWDLPWNGQDRKMTGEEADRLGLTFALAQVPIVLAPTPSDVAARADVLTVHLALVPATRGFINEAIFSRLKPGSIFVNASRGEIVDEAALTAAVKERGLKVGLDVFAQEPAEATGVFADPIVKESGVYGTHHIGASTDQAQEAVAAETVRIVTAFKDRGDVPNRVS